MAQRVLDYIHEHPERHHQYTYVTYNDDRDFYKPAAETNFCGTTMCIAGTAVYFNALDRNTSMQNILGDSLYNVTTEWDHIGGPLLGLENPQEYVWLFGEMNNERAVQKLKHLVVGEIVDVREY